jgi:acetyltransferase-like isoleucine patch superfamily enzyme
MPPPVRHGAAALINWAWRWIAGLGAVSPDDRVGRKFRSMGEGSCIAFPPGAVSGESCISIGRDTLVAPFVSLAVGMPGEPLERHSEAVISIGDRCVLGRGSSIIARSRVTIEDDVATGPYVYVTDHNHSYGDLEVPIGRQWPADDTVRIGAGSWLGSSVVVLPGADIGRHVAVAAGSVVRGVIPDFSVAAGVPAKVVRHHVEGEGWVPSGPSQRARAPEGWAAS